MNQNQNNNFLKISDEAEFDRPANRHFMPLEWKEWNRIKGAVSRIKDVHNRWENTAWAFTAFCFTLALQYFIEYGKNLPDTARGMFFFMGAILCLAIALICFIVSLRESNILNESKDSVMNDMNEIESNIRKAQAESSPLQSDELLIVSATYGLEEKMNDVKEIITSYIKDNSLKLLVNNETMGGDPYEGKVKNLNIKYQSEGKIHEKSVEEYKELVLP
jgi:hypothetical protein